MSRNLYHCDLCDRIYGDDHPVTVQCPHCSTIRPVPLPEHRLPPGAAAVSAYLFLFLSAAMAVFWWMI